MQLTREAHQEKTIEEASVMKQIGVGGNSLGIATASRKWSINGRVRGN
jgi:hypothetical protein